MKKILIVSYYARPCNAIGANRVTSWISEFRKRGYETTLITRSWNGDENSWDDLMGSSKAQKVEIIKEGDSTTIYIPYKRTRSNSSFVKRKVEFVLNYLKGNFQNETDSLQFWSYIEKNFTYKCFDCCIVTAEPYNLVKLGFKINRKFDIPLAVDFRDYFNHFTMTTSQRKNTFSQWMEYLLTQWYIKKWTNDGIIITSVTEPLVSHLNKTLKPSAKLVYNGFDDLVMKYAQLPTSRERFIFSIIGHINTRQSISTMLEGIKIFMDTVEDPQVEFNFIGVNSVKSVSKRIKKDLPFNEVKITNRLSRDKALQIASTSHLLYYPSYEGYQGFYSGKLLEYLGLRRNIIVSPGNDQLVNNLIKKSKSGKVAKNSQGFGKILIEYYEEWFSNRELNYFGDDDVINSFSREAQANEFILELEKRIYNQNK